MTDAWYFFASLASFQIQSHRIHHSQLSSSIIQCHFRERFADREFGALGEACAGQATSPDGYGKMLRDWLENCSWLDKNWRVYKIQETWNHTTWAMMISKKHIYTLVGQHKSKSIVCIVTPLTIDDCCAQEIYHIALKSVERRKLRITELLLSSHHHQSFVTSIH